MRRGLCGALFALCALGCEGSSAEMPEGGAGGGRAQRHEEPTAGRDAATDASEVAHADASAPLACGPEGECDLLEVDACGAAMSCILLRAEMLSSDDDAGAIELDEDAGVVLELGPTCVAAGSGSDGDACAGPSACGPGLDCTAATDGVCRRYCCELNTTSGCPRGQFCRVELRDALGESTGAALCDACDGCELLASRCPQGQACYPLAASTGMCHACLPAGELTPSAGCTFSNECAPGSTCLELDGERRCVELCQLGGTACGEHGACTPVRDAPFGTDIGLCSGTTAER